MSTSLRREEQSSLPGCLEHKKAEAQQAHNSSGRVSMNAAISKQRKKKRKRKIGKRAIKTHLCQLFPFDIYF